MMSKWKLDLHTAVREPTSPHLLNLSAGIVKHLPRWTLSLVVMYNLSEAPFLVPLQQITQAYRGDYAAGKQRESMLLRLGKTDTGATATIDRGASSLICDLPML